MSKITQALEKAARERLRRQQQEQPTSEIAPTSALEKPPVTVPPGNGDAAIDPHIVVAADPKSSIAEQYRILRTNLRSLRSGVHRMQVLLVTSSVHSEGKSVTAVNLALSLAQQEGMKILLIDADLRCGSVQQWLGLKAEKGLSDALIHGAALENLIVGLPNSRLSVLPAGRKPEHPAELLDSAAMERLIGTVRREFDLVVIDAPPILPVADPGILGRWTDGVLLVVRSGKTQRKTVEKAKTLLKQMKVNLLGCILSHAEYYIPNYYRYSQYRYGDGNPPSEAKQASPVAAVSV